MQNATSGVVREICELERRLLRHIPLNPEVPSIEEPDTSPATIGIRVEVVWNRGTLEVVKQWRHHYRRVIRRGEILQHENST